MNVATNSLVIIRIGFLLTRVYVMMLFFADLSTRYFKLIADFP